MNAFKSLLENLSIIKTPAHIEKENKVMAVISPTNTPSEPTTPNNVPTPIPGGVPGTGTPAPQTNPNAPTNPWSSETVKAGLRSQRVEYSSALVSLVEQKQSQLNSIAATEDNIQFVIRQIKDIDTKLSS